jgi:hypothetical protein
MNTIMTKGQDMNEHATDLDQADEDILTYDVSDEELEAAGMEGLYSTIPGNSLASWTNCYRCTASAPKPPASR